MTHVFASTARFARSYALVTTWQFLSMKAILPMVAIVQLLIAGGTVYGLGYMAPGVDPVSAKFIVTGATTMALVTLGLVLVPQLVAQMKERDSFDYLWSLPVPRFAYLFADFTVWTIVVLPGVVVALLLGSHHYGFTLDVSWGVVLAFLLTALTSVSVGMSLAHLSNSSMLTGVITNVIMFSLFLFSPVNYPIERLPEWLQAVHHVLPIMYMADLVRGTLTTGLVDDVGTAALVVAGWCCASVIALAVVFTRRA